MNATAVVGLAASLSFVALVGLGVPADAQSASASSLPPTAITLEDMSGFRATGTSWRVAGPVSSERQRQHHLVAGPGSGVLVNLPTRGAPGANLFTEWEHGDIDLAMEVLIPRGSNSGIYLQGRYELQLLDSWGVRAPTFSDVGGIYQRWDESRPEGMRGYQGHPPRMNASRAPGLWQSLEIAFRAPRFDAAGAKVEDARFVRVVLNGSVIHENVELTGPTRGSAYPEEAPLGPLMIQGDHGPVAFRNLRYKKFTGERIGVADLRFAVAEGEFPDLTRAQAQDPVRRGETDGISSAIADLQDQFAVTYEGTLHVPVAGKYVFDVELDWISDDPHFAGRVVGGARLSVDGRQVLVNDGLSPTALGSIELAAGAHPFSFFFYKNRPWTNRRVVGLWAEGPEIERHPLHDVGATRVNIPDPITLQPGTEPVVLRGFVRHQGNTRTHAIAVGDPAEVHYTYDLAQGALLQTWRGPFAETTDMWHGRGERQLAEPLGSVLRLSGAPVLAVLATENAAWPDSTGVNDGFRSLGYSLDEQGRPTFRYRLGDLEIEDRIRPAENGSVLQRELVIRGAAGTAGVYARLADGEQVRRLSDGSYQVGDLEYYLTLERGSPRPIVRTVAGGEELLVPIQLRGGEARLTYTIVW